MLCGIHSIDKWREILANHIGDGGDGVVVIDDMTQGDIRHAHRVQLGGSAWQVSVTVRYRKLHARTHEVSTTPAPLD
jgi:hypothetical protein